MEKTKIDTKKLFFFLPLFIIILGALLILSFIYDVPKKKESTQSTIFGVTFSTAYAKELGLDWKKVYIALLDDLQIRYIRIPVYWNEVEKQEGKYDFAHVQWMMDEAAARNARVTLAIGNRVPRWPECHPPKWIKNKSTEKMQQAELEMITKVVQEFQDHEALYRWQVHNEPFFDEFGECPPPDESFIRSSIEHVRTLDPDHHIQTTDSGELSTWKKTADVSDVLGVSVYRVTWNPIFKYFYYPLPPLFYQKKAEMIDPLVSEIIVSELQAEPWVKSTIATTPLEEQFISMDANRFWKNVEYAQRIGFSETYLWGVEWWYWLKEKHNDESMWNAGKELYLQGSLQK